MPSSYSHVPDIAADQMDNQSESAAIFAHALNQVSSMLSNVRNGLFAHNVDLANWEIDSDGMYHMPIAAGSPLAELAEYARITRDWLRQTTAIDRLPSHMQDGLINRLTGLMYPIVIGNSANIRQNLSPGLEGYARLLQYYTAHVEQLNDGGTPPSSGAARRPRRGHVGPMERLRALSEVLTENGSSIEQQHETVRRAIQQVLDANPPQEDAEATDPMELYAYEVIRDLTGIRSRSPASVTPAPTTPVEEMASNSNDVNPFRFDPSRQVIADGQPRWARPTPGRAPVATPAIPIETINSFGLVSAGHRIRTTTASDTS